MYNEWESIYKELKEIRTCVLIGIVGPVTVQPEPSQDPELVTWRLRGPEHKPEGQQALGPSTHEPKSWAWTGPNPSSRQWGPSSH